MKRLFKQIFKNIFKKNNQVTTLNHLNHGFKPFEPNQTELLTPPPPKKNKIKIQIVKKTEPLSRQANSSVLWFGSVQTEPLPIPSRVESFI